MTRNRSYLITGANVGLGKEAARQLGLRKETGRILLACRNQQKAEEARQELESLVGRSIFDIVLLDISDADSVRAAVRSLSQPVDAVLLNAGGSGGRQPLAPTASGMTAIAATNLLGHVVLVDELIKQGKVIQEVMYVSSEGARGIKGIMSKPQLKTHSVTELISVLDGSFSEPELNAKEAYAYVKYLGTLWTAANARKYPQLKFISVSPGNTSGTAVHKDLPLLTRLAFQYFFAPVVMPLLGMIHDVKQGAARYVEAFDNPRFESGEFYGSRAGKVTGSLVAQGAIYPEFRNTIFQDNADKALHSFVK